MTHIQILLKHHKFILENYEAIMGCSHYRNSIIEVFIHDDNYNGMKPNLGNLLNLWKNVEAYINNNKVYLVSVRQGSKFLKGSGINVENGHLEVGHLEITDIDVDTIFQQIKTQDTNKLYLPLNYVVVELSGKYEYLRLIEEVDNTFFSRLNLEAILEKQDITDKVFLSQQDEDFIISIKVEFDIKGLHKNCADDREFRNCIEMLREHVKYGVERFGYLNLHFESNHCIIDKKFQHPSLLLKDETHKEILFVITTLEKILDGFMKK